MELTDDLKVLLIETATTLKGANRRRFMAQTVQALGRGGQSRAEQELGWNRGLIRKGTLELTHDMTCLDAFQLRGRKSAEDPQTLRISIDAKATVNLGPFSRGGKSRIPTEAADHDFQPEERMTPVGILMTESDELFVYGVTSKVTSDCLVDRLQQWWNEVRQRFESTTTLLINLDNGPECHSRRSQFMLRMVKFVRDTGLTVKLAYYPPYHSKYNPIERCWGMLEKHWNGSLLDGLQVALDFIETMKWRGVHPIANAITTIYHTGVKLSKDAMDALESCFIRDPQLGKWFVTISPDTVSSVE